MFTMFSRWPSVLAFTLCLSMALVTACAESASGPAVTPTQAANPSSTPVATKAVTPSPIPTKASAALPTPTSTPIKIGLVTDQGGIRDKAFNQAAWEGVQKSAQEFGFQTQVIEASNSPDLAANIDKLITDGCNVVISVGYLMADVTAAKAIQNPQTRFAILDVAYVPEKGSSVCDETKKDCYHDGNLKNVTSLLFQEDEAGFLAGVVAGGMTKTGVVASVAAMELPPLLKWVTGYQHGARFINPQVETLNVFLDHFDKPDQGREAAFKLIDEKADIIFGLGGTTGNAALVAAKERGVMAIGVDMDQYLTVPEAKEALLTSAMKNVDLAVYDYLKTVNAGTVEAGVVTSNLKNGGVGLAPFHDWEDKIPQSVKEKIKEASAGLLSGKVATGYRP
ncbi:MAG: BMP family lipoprotein [Chloroflexota bacterium]